MPLRVVVVLSVAHMPPRMVLMVMHHVAYLRLHFVQALIRARGIRRRGLRGCSSLLCRSGSGLRSSVRRVGTLSNLRYATFKSAKARIGLIDPSVYDGDMFIDVVLGRTCA